MWLGEAETTASLWKFLETGMWLQKPLVLSEHVFVCVFVLKENLFRAISSSGVTYPSASENNGAGGSGPNYTV